MDRILLTGPARLSIQPCIAAARGKGGCGRGRGRPPCALAPVRGDTGAELNLWVCPALPAGADMPVLLV
eukprot:COSAG01_NODE_521_length_15963_cov_76.378530_20_plen_69_part_00